MVLAVGPGAHPARGGRARWPRRRPGAALVIDEESPAPRIITERDVLLSVGSGEDPDTERVADHMSDSVISAAPDWSLERAATEMSRRGIRHLVVYDGAGAGRRALDARHRAGLDLRGRHLGHDSRLTAEPAQPLSFGAAASATPPAAPRCCGRCLSGRE